MNIICNIMIFVILFFIAQFELKKV